MVKIERSPTPPKSLEEEKAKPNSENYRGMDVVRLLRKSFHQKCYICGLKPAPDIEVEHLRPHHGGKDRDLMFDWNNLFLSCRHCNNIKNRKKYEQNVVDCCALDPELLVEQRIEYKIDDPTLPEDDWNFETHVYVNSRNESDEAIVTAELIQDCFERREYGIRESGSEVRSELLMRHMECLRHALEKYSAEGQTEEKKAERLSVLRGMLSRKYKFAGFARMYVRDHLDQYPELEDLVCLNPSIPQTYNVREEEDT